MIEKMRDPKKSSVASKALLVDRRQIKKISLPEDCPSRIGVKSKLSRSSAAHLKNRLAWYVALNTKTLEDKISHVPQIKWKCPPKFTLNTGWCIAAGEGSQEAATQKCRETTVLEVVYHDLTAIPPSPFTSPHMEGECSDSSQTPIIPIIPIEEVAAEMPFDASATTVDTQFNPPPPASDKVPSVVRSVPLSQCDPSGPQDQTVHDKSLADMLRGLESGDLEVAVAAAATVAAVMENKEQIDTELLIKFLTDPEMVQKLIDGNGSTAKPENGTPPAREPNTSLPFPNSTPASVVDKVATECSEPLKRATHSNFMPRAVNQSPVLPCSNGNGLTARHENGTLPAPEPHAPLHFPRSTPASVVDKAATECSETLRRATPSSFTPQAVNQSLVLPCSNGNGLTTRHENGTLSAPEPHAPLHFPSSTPASVVDKATIECSETLRRAIPSNFTPQAVNQSLVLPCSNGNRLTARPENGTPPAPERNTPSPFPSSTPASVVDKVATECSEPLRRAIPSNFTPKAVNHSLVLPCSTVETEINKSASKLSGTRAGSGKICTQRPVKKSSPSPRSDSYVPPIKNLTSEPAGPAQSHIHQIAGTKQVRTLMPSTLRPDEETINRLINKYGVPDIAGIMPVAPLNPSTSKPNVGVIKEMIHAYGAHDAAGVKLGSPLIASTSRPPNMEEIQKTVNESEFDHGWRRPFMGPSPMLFAPTPLRPVAKLHALPNALESDFTAPGNSRFPFYSPLATPAPKVDLNYFKSLIKQHGEKHEPQEQKLPKIGQPRNILQGLESAHNNTSIVMNSKHQKPCLYFNSSKGCRNGYNCPYQHGVSEQWRATGAVEAPVAKRMKFTEPVGKF